MRSSGGMQIITLVAFFVLIWHSIVLEAAILKPSIEECLKNLPPFRSLSLDVNQLVVLIPLAEESCQCVGRTGGAITEIFATIFTEKLGIKLPECLLKAVKDSDSEIGGTFSFFENMISSLVSEVTNDIIFGKDESRGSHDTGSL
ncbi:uncharacterized protein LOC114828425 [Galendromus occidentalis]|uniref:Uncharacterized protein LOC114828425 n=1 Tax=Galendromus occidentalis TaxID=34638 RepID=A0AAJ7SHX8_9ACAR|nr:uncharacterized protein LOC114828425 [Galendromus occidentalis]